MADKTVVHMGENSPEKVAYELMKDIANVEGKVLYQSRNSEAVTADRKWILDTYAQCLMAVLQPWNRE